MKRRTRLLYRYTITDPAVANDNPTIVGHYGNRDLPLAALVKNLGRAIAYHQVVDRVYVDPDGRHHQVDLVPPPAL